MKGVLVVAQSGGPSAVINASLAGVIHEAQQHTCFSAIYGLVHGIEGALNQTMLDLTAETQETLALLQSTPGAALGSSRYKIRDDDYAHILEVFEAHNVHYFIYMGGNGSMYVTQRLAASAAERGYDLGVMGVPKTIDNDLSATDHAPGFGSAARFMALAARDTGRDLEAMATFDDVTILEAMGRNSGWLAAASALLKQDADDAPHLVYVPEIAFDEDVFLADVAAVHDRLGYVFVVVGEGIKDADGEFVGARTFGPVHDTLGRVVHSLTGGPATYLTELVRSRLGLQTRNLRPGLISRAFSACQSNVDQAEAFAVGQVAARHLASGASGMMVNLQRLADEPYAWQVGTVPLDEVAGIEKLLPRHYLDESGKMISTTFTEYALPLLGTLPPPLTRLSGRSVIPLQRSAT